MIYSQTTSSRSLIRPVSIKLGFILKSILKKCIDDHAPIIIMVTYWSGGDYFNAVASETIFNGWKWKLDTVKTHD